MAVQWPSLYLLGRSRSHGCSYSGQDCICWVGPGLTAVATVAKTVFVG